MKKHSFSVEFFWSGGREHEVNWGRRAVRLWARGSRATTDDSLLVHLAPSHHMCLLNQHVSSAVGTAANLPVAGMRIRGPRGYRCAPCATRTVTRSERTVSQQAARVMLGVKVRLRLIYPAAAAFELEATRLSGWWLWHPRWIGVSVCELMSVSWDQLSNSPSRLGGR